MSEKLTDANGKVGLDLRRRFSVGHVILGKTPRQPKIKDNSRLRNVFGNRRSGFPINSTSYTALERAEYGTGNTYSMKVYTEGFTTKLCSDSGASLAQIHIGLSHWTLSFAYKSDYAESPLVVYSAKQRGVDSAVYSALQSKYSPISNK